MALLRPWGRGGWSDDRVVYPPPLLSSAVIASTTSRWRSSASSFIRVVRSSMRARISCVWASPWAMSACVSRWLWAISRSVARLMRHDTSPKMTARMKPIKLAAPAAVLNQSQIIALPPAPPADTPAPALCASSATDSRTPGTWPDSGPSAPRYTCSGGRPAARACPRLPASAPP
jgi:hypothetical protein